jgi:hypothetical protein
MYSSVVLVAVCALLTRDPSLALSWTIMAAVSCQRIPLEEESLVELFASSDPSYATYRKLCPWRLVPGALGHLGAWGETSSVHGCYVYVCFRCMKVCTCVCEHCTVVCGCSAHSCVRAIVITVMCCCAVPAAPGLY